MRKLQYQSQLFLLQINIMFDCVGLPNHENHAHAT